MSNKNFSGQFRLSSEEWEKLLSFLVSTLALILSILATILVKPFTFIALVIVLVVGIVFVLAFIKVIRGKKLTLCIMDVVPLVKINEHYYSATVGKRVHIEFDAQEVGNLHTILSEIHNSGSAEITTKDFKGKSPKITFSKEKFALKDVVLKSKDDQDMEVLQINGDNSFNIPAFSLAKQDWLKLRVIAELINPKEILKKEDIHLGDRDDWGVQIYREDRWRDRYIKQKKRLSSWLIMGLCIVCVFSGVVWGYIWFFYNDKYNGSNLIPLLGLILGLIVIYVILITFVISSSLTRRTPL